MTYLPGIVVLLLTIGDVRRGDANLLGLGRRHDVTVYRAESGLLFWVAVILQLLAAAGLLLLGRYFQGALG